MPVKVSIKDGKISIKAYLEIPLKVQQRDILVQTYYIAWLLKPYV